MRGYSLFYKYFAPNVAFDTTKSWPWISQPNDPEPTLKKMLRNILKYKLLWISLNLFDGAENFIIFQKEKSKRIWLVNKIKLISNKLYINIMKYNAYYNTASG